MANASSFSTSYGPKMDYGFLAAHVANVTGEGDHAKLTGSYNLLQQLVSDQEKAEFSKHGLNAPVEIDYGPADDTFTYPGGSYDPGELPTNNVGSLYLTAEDHSWNFSIDGFNLSFAKMVSLAANGRLLDVIFAGNDTITTIEANDVLNAQGGDDDITDSGGSNTIHGGRGNDTILTYTASGDKVGKNALYGDSGNDKITGANGADRIDGGSGQDTMAGGLGNDTYVVDNTKDTVTEWSAAGGVDTVLSSVGYTLGARVENLRLTGGNHVNANGNELDNVLTGNSGKNILKGFDGADILVGGSGIDTLTGGRGKDTFVFDTTLSSKSADNVIDFDHAADTFDIDSAVFIGLKLGTLAKADFTLISSAKSTAGVDASDRVLYDKAHGDLYFDRDGSKHHFDRVLFAHVADGTVLNNLDFHII